VVVVGSIRFFLWIIVLLTCVCVLAYRSANQDVRYTLDKFLEMRRNTAAYSVFYSTFIPPIVGRSLMKKLVEDDTVFEEISTISDEAIALLALENGVTFLPNARATSDRSLGVNRFQKG
jgi:hypothetical protein